MPIADLFDLQGKVALLTGSSKGMGMAMASALAQRGARVMISGRNADTCSEAAAMINAQCGTERALYATCNASSKDQLQQLVDVTHDRIGPIDILVGNAGTNAFHGPMSRLTDEAYDKVMSTNVKSNHWLAQMVAPAMAKTGGGSIIFTSSVGAFLPSNVLGAYHMSKLALIGLTRNLAAELGPCGIRVNAICPGLIRTDFARAVWSDEATSNRVTENIPLGRLGDAEDMMGAAVFLASDASAYMTGQSLTICGGYHM